MNNDDQNTRITWSPKTGSQSDGTQSSATPLVGGDTSDVGSQSSIDTTSSALPITRKNHRANDTFDAADASVRAADRQQASAQPTSDINTLKDEIAAALASSAAPRFDPAQSTVKTRSDDIIDIDAPADNVATEYVPPVVPVSESTMPTNDVPKAPSVPAPDEQELITSIKNDIAAKMGSAKMEEAAPAVEKTTAATTGLGQTYYSDLSKAMSSNEPATMSELIRKARFEEREKKVLSPKSRRNIIFITAAAILLIASIIILATVFKPEKKVEFIKEQSVSSLVYANTDTGINVTGLESSRIKQAVRDVIELENPEDTINQIYYAQEDSVGNLRRLGVKDIFEKTDNQTPELLYDNIQNEFTHGVYTTDKNYPFILMKVLSYDRALDGLLEWEPSMIDDLATYLDLPPEGTDRSLLKPGFEDDLIRNKNVRVARFLPREVDRRGILDFLRGGDEAPEPGITDAGQAPLETSAQEESPLVSFINRLNTQIFGSMAFAQNTQSPAVTGSSFGNLGANQSVGNNGDDPNVVTANDAISQITRTQPVCFSRLTGDVIEKESGDHSTPIGELCYEVYQCYRYRCFINNVPVSQEREGEPGYQCREDIASGKKYHKDDPRYNEELHGGEVRCKNYYGLTRIENISDGLLCFDKDNGNYVPSTTNYPGEVECRSPLTRSGQICIDAQNNVVSPGSSANAVCIDAPENTASNLATNNGNFNQGQAFNQEQAFNQGQAFNQLDAIDIGICEGYLDGEFQTHLYTAGTLLIVGSAIGSLFDLSQADIQNMNRIAQVLFQMARGGDTGITAVSDGLEIVRQLDLILNALDPNRQLPETNANGETNLYGQVLRVINIVKCVFGVGDTLQWITSDSIDPNAPVYAGQSAPNVEPIQQTLVQIGLLNPLSVTGSLDLVTQDAISQFQLANSLVVNGILDTQTLELMTTILENQGQIIETSGNDLNTSGAIITDYFAITANGNVESEGILPTGDFFGLGSYNIGVQNMQILLYAEGYDINVIDGVFTQNTCDAIIAYQEDQGLETADPISCQVSTETLGSFNNLIRRGNYLGSGFRVNGQGALSGIGSLSGLSGPGVLADFSVNPNVANADSLDEGDIVLMYMFLDEETLLIARDEVVIDEIVRRRALSDIFN